MCHKSEDAKKLSQDLHLIITITVTRKNGWGCMYPKIHAQQVFKCTPLFTYLRNKYVLKIFVEFLISNINTYNQQKFSTSMFERAEKCNKMQDLTIEFPL